MSLARREEETELLEQVVRHKADYRSVRTAAVNEERERRHRDGEVYNAGAWMPRTDVERVDRGLRRHDRLVFFETHVILVLLTAMAYGLWQLFSFMALP